MLLCHQPPHTFCSTADIISVLTLIGENVCNHFFTFYFGDILTCQLPVSACNAHRRLCLPGAWAGGASRGCTSASYSTKPQGGCGSSVLPPQPEEPKARPPGRPLTQSVNVTLTVPDFPGDFPPFRARGGFLLLCDHELQEIWPLNISFHHVD